MPASRRRTARLADEVSATLRRLRRERGLFQFQAAVEFGVSEVAWSRYETARCPVPDDLLMVVALSWHEPRLLDAHPLVALRRWMSTGPDDPLTPAPIARVA
ncbi:MAG: helix-turn-helix domain-containing protein [Chloroflexota bacterium]|nr:helix-turn-helix domain-containing protein [Chloroflexota bacterium]